MNFGTAFVILVVVVFTVALYPTLESAISNGSVTGPLAPFFPAIPEIFLVTVIGALALLAIKRRK